MTARPIAIVVLETNHWATINRDPVRVADAVNSCTSGSCIEVDFDRPPLREKGRGPKLDL